MSRAGGKRSEEQKCEEKSARNAFDPFDALKTYCQRQFSFGVRFPTRPTAVRFVRKPKTLKYHTNSFRLTYEMHTNRAKINAATKNIYKFHIVVVIGWSLNYLCTLRDSPTKTTNN